MSVEIDARGLVCPQPVIMTKRVTNTHQKEISVLVDNRAAVENVTRFARHMGYDVKVVDIGNAEHRLELKK